MPVGGKPRGEPKEALSSQLCVAGERTRASPRDGRASRPSWPSELGPEGLVNNSKGSSRFRPELHIPVTLLQHPQVDGPKSPLYLDFSARQHSGSDGRRTKHGEPARKCGVRGVSLTSLPTASEILHSFHT